MRTVGASAEKRAEAGQTADGRTFRVGAPGPWRRMAATTISVAMKKLLPKAPACCKINALGDVAQQVRALRSHRRGRGFEPLHPHHQHRNFDTKRIKVAVLNFCLFYGLFHLFYTFDQR